MKRRGNKGDGGGGGVRGAVVRRCSVSRSAAVFTAADDEH